MKKKLRNLFEKQDGNEEFTGSVKGTNKHTPLSIVLYV